MDSDVPFEFFSKAIQKDKVTHMFVGVGKRAKGTMKVRAYKFKTD